MASKKEYRIEEHIYEMLLELFKLECSTAFHFPVDIVASRCPDYFNIIKDPMDLTTLKFNYSEGRYRKLNEVKAEIEKIINNCRTYNRTPNHPIRKSCDKFEQCFLKRWKALDQQRLQLGLTDNCDLIVDNEKLRQIEEKKSRKKETHLLGNANVKQISESALPIKIQQNFPKDSKYIDYEDQQSHNEVVQNEKKQKSEQIFLDEDQSNLRQDDQFKENSQPIPVPKLLIKPLPPPDQVSFTQPELKVKISLPPPQSVMSNQPSTLPQPQPQITHSSQQDKKQTIIKMPTPAEQRQQQMLHQQQSQPQLSQHEQHPLEADLKQQPDQKQKLPQANSTNEQKLSSTPPLKLDNNVKDPVQKAQPAVTPQAAQSAQPSIKPTIKLPPPSQLRVFNLPPPPTLVEQSSNKPGEQQTQEKQISVQNNEFQEPKQAVTSKLANPNPQPLNKISSEQIQPSPQIPNLMSQKIRQEIKYEPIEQEGLNTSHQKIKEIAIQNKSNTPNESERSNTKQEPRQVTGLENDSLGKHDSKKEIKVDQPQDSNRQDQNIKKQDTQVASQKITLPHPQSAFQLGNSDQNFLSSIKVENTKTIKQEQLIKPINPMQTPEKQPTSDQKGIQHKPVTATPKHKTKVIESDDEEDEQKYEQIPIQKKIESEKKRDSLNQPNAQSKEVKDSKVSKPHHHSHQSPSQSKTTDHHSNKGHKEVLKHPQSQGLGSSEVGKSMSSHSQQPNQQINTQKQPVQNQPQQKQLPDQEQGAATTFIIKIDIQSCIKAAEEYRLRKRDKHFMLLKKILSQIKGTLEMYRKEGGESLTMVLNSFDKPNFTVIRMLLQMMQCDLMRLPFTESQNIYRYLRLAIKCYHKLGIADEDEELMNQFKTIFESQTENLRLQERRILNKTQNNQIENPISNQARQVVSHYSEHIDYNRLVKNIKLKNVYKRNLDKQPNQTHQPITIEPIVLKKVQLTNPSSQAVRDAQASSRFDDSDKETELPKLQQPCKIQQIQIQHEESDTKPNFLFAKAIDAIQIDETLNYGNVLGQFPHINVESAVFYLINKNQYNFGFNKNFVEEQIQDLRQIQENLTAQQKKEIQPSFNAVSKSNFKIDQRSYSNLYEIHKIDNFVEIMVKMTHSEKEDFAIEHVRNIFVLTFHIQNIVSQRTASGFSNYRDTNEEFLIKLATLSEYITKPLMQSLPYQQNEDFVQGMSGLEIVKKANIGLNLTQQFKNNLQDKFEYLFFIQMRIPFSLISDLKISINNTIIFPFRQ